MNTPDPNMEIRPESPRDEDAIRHVLQQAFASPAEAALVEALRAGGYAAVSLVATSQSQVVGHILFSPLTVQAGSKGIAALALAPVAVLPEAQSRGIGSALIRAGLQHCRKQAVDAVVVLGEPEYYGRFGFSAELAAALSCPYSGPYLMALELVPGVLDGMQGRITYAPPFAAL